MGTETAKKAARILVVDDEPEITEIIEAFLDNAGYQVRVLNKAQDAIDNAVEGEPLTEP